MAARRRSRRRRYWAGLLICAWQADRETTGLEARRQLIEALHITGEKLDVAYRGDARAVVLSTSRGVRILE